jgi:hypothetical protein
VARNGSYDAEWSWPQPHPSELSPRSSRVTDADFDRDGAAVLADLTALKQILENAR